MARRSGRWESRERGRARSIASLGEILAGFPAVQCGVFASTAAAREAGRAIGTAPDAATGLARATRAAQLAVEDQSEAASDMRVASAAAGVDCDGFTPAPAPGRSAQPT